TGDDLNRASHSFFAIARLKDGVSLARARAVMRAMGARLAAAYPASNAGETVNVFPMRDLWVQDVQHTLQILLVAVSLVLLIASGLLPAMTALPSGPAELLRESGGARSSATRRTRRIKSLLIGVEVALTMVVLVGAGLLLSSIRRVHQVPPGLDATNVVALRV